MKKISHGKSERHFISGGKIFSTMSEVSQASPARPSGKDSMKMKTVEWEEVVALYKGWGIMAF
jgi:hypothetical protein